MSRQKNWNRYFLSKLGHSLFETHFFFNPEAGGFQTIFPHNQGFAGFSFSQIF
jgi:hypothetical protein